MIRAILLCQNGVTADFSACVSKYRKILWVDRNRCCGGTDESQPDILLLEAGPGRYPRNFQADILLIAKDVSELRGNTDGMMRKNGIAVLILRALRTFPFCAQNSLPPLPVVSMKKIRFPFPASTTIPSY